MAGKPGAHLIKPVVYETSLGKVREAFAKGCGAVIVDGVVPESVVAEAPRMGGLNTAFHMVCRNNNVQPVWRDSCEDYTLPETGRWLAEEIRQVASAGLGWAYDAKDDILELMTVWANTAVQTEWHTDNRDKEFVARPDVHIHIYGEGLVVASPPEDKRLMMFKSGASHVWAAKSGDKTPDQLLQERGFTLIHLQPGQKLFFNDQCLHRSADNIPGQMKMRAAMF